MYSWKGQVSAVNHFITVYELMILIDIMYVTAPSKCMSYMSQQ